MKKSTSRVLSVLMVLLMVLSMMTPMVVLADDPTGTNITSNITLGSITLKDNDAPAPVQNGDIIGWNSFTLNFTWSTLLTELNVGDWFSFEFDFGENQPTTLPPYPIEFSPDGTGGKLSMTWTLLPNGKSTVRIEVIEKVTGASGTIKGTGTLGFGYGIGAGAGKTVTWTINGVVYSLKNDEGSGGTGDFIPAVPAYKSGLISSSADFIKWVVSINEGAGAIDAETVTITDEMYLGGEADKTHKLVTYRDSAPDFDAAVGSGATKYNAATGIPKFEASPASATANGYFSDSTGGGIKVGDAYLAIYTIDQNGLRDIWKDAVSSETAFESATSDYGFRSLVSLFALNKYWHDNDANKADLSDPYMKGAFEWYKNFSDTMETLDASAVKSLTVNDGGFVLELDGAKISNKQIIILYCTQPKPGTSGTSSVFKNQVTSSHNSKPGTYGFSHSWMGGTVTAADESILLKKVDNNSYPISDEAEFTITRYVNDAATGDPISITTSGTNGSAASGYLTPGPNVYYKLTEVTPPTGYTGLSDPIYFQLVQDGGAGLYNTLVLGRIVEGDFAADTTGFYDGIATAAAGTRELTVINQLTTTPTEPAGSALITATKDVGAYTGDIDKLFEFSLFDSDDELIETVKNNGDGEIAFTPISLTEADIGASPLTYTIREKTTSFSDSDGSWTCDNTEYTVNVVVEEDSENDGNLVATITYKDAAAATNIDPLPTPPTFVNEYTPAPAAGNVEVVIRAMKTVTGTTLSADQFTFELYDDEGERIGTAQNNGDGEIAFDPLEYTADDIGTHTYTIKEFAESVENWQYDLTVYNVTVEIDKELTTNLVYTDLKEGDELPTFVNSYSTTSGPGPTPTPTPNTSTPTPTPTPTPPTPTLPTPTPPTITTFPVRTSNPSTTPSTPTIPPVPTPEPTPEPTPPPNPPVLPTIESLPTMTLESVYTTRDGGFVVITDEGVPLGKWSMDEDYVWIFDEEVPLADQPKMGDSINPIVFLSLALVCLVGIGGVAIYPLLKRKRKNQV